VSSGDNFLAGLNLNASFANGVPWYDAIAGSAIGIDAMTLGNHDFDFGPAALADFISGFTSDTTFLSANLDVRGEPALRAVRRDIRPWTIVRRGGDRIGVIGLTTPLIRSISSPGPNIGVDEDLAGVTQRAVRDLRRRGVNKIVLSSHLQGIASEEALIPQLRGVDVVIAGGGDELLANPDDTLIPNPPSSTPPAGPYPKLVTDARGRAVPIVTTQGEYRYVGRLTLDFDHRGRIRTIDDGLSGPVRVSGRDADPDVAAPDPALVTAIDTPLAAYRAALNANVLATSEVPLDGRNPDPIRRREANLGNLVADGFLHAARKLGRDPDVAITNGGGIRNSNVIAAGPLSEGQTFDILPFDNLIATVSVTRAQLSSAGRFAQIGGMKVEVDTSRQARLTSSTCAVTSPPGERVRRVQLDDGTLIVDGGAVVPGPDVVVATTDFLAKGGDCYPFPAGYSPTPVAYQQALEDYLVDPVAGGGLGGLVRATDYPVGGEGRITITPALPPLP
ncbi:MAG: 5'-nucleotidase C-terminal domain-containing protein, partial [Solirubrobacteraceae bacterium]|nr:5'-nucleotidase C-terminal domain-containing protein [Solirubrobacteraceae bacterium]